MCLCIDATLHYRIGLYWIVNCEFGTLSRYVLFFSRVYLHKRNLYRSLPNVAIKQLTLVIHIYVVTGSILGKLS
jgi:hypothetical protein